MVNVPLRSLASASAPASTKSGLPVPVRRSTSVREACGVVFSVVVTEMPWLLLEVTVNASGEVRAL